MQPERWRQVDEILGAALEREGSERSAFLDEACAGDAALRYEVESLLAHDRAADQVVQALGDAAQSLFASVTMKPGTKVGDYEIQKLIGSGGMGEVYRARDSKLNRDVAIKVLPESVGRDPDSLARFQREA